MRHHHYFCTSLTIQFSTVNVISLLTVCSLFWCGASANELNYYLDKYASDTMQSMHANFSLVLLSRIAEDESAALLSPASLAITLSLISAAAAGTTRSQMNEAFAKGFSDDAVQEYYSVLAGRLLQESNGTKITSPATLLVLHTCNNAATDKTIQEIARDYFAEIHQFNCYNTSATMLFVNQWVTNQTKSEYKVFTNDVYNVEWQLLLIDIFYLNVAWQYQFDNKRTILRDFYISDHALSQVEMMSMWAFDRFKYTEDADVQVLALPYETKSNLTLYIFLPRVKFALKRIVLEMTGRRLLYLMARCKTVDIEVEIPKFTIENHFELNLPLASLGIIEAFTSRADFPAISTERIHVSMVIQKTQFEINEKGSYPVNISYGRSSDQFTRLWQGGHIKFIANHPFMFVVMHTDQVIFIGRYSCC